MVVSSACGPKHAEDGRSPEQRANAQKTDKDAHKGALKEKADPAADLKKQELNLERLHSNANGDREAGNRVGAWAANQDARQVERLIEKDKRLVSGKSE